MAVMGLPGTDLDQLRKQAKDWLRRGRSGDPEALGLLRQLHPRGEELAADPSRLRLADAQLALARAYDFPSWPKLREHLRMVEPWRRNPHRLGERTDPADELLRLACLTYGADDGVRPARAAALLQENPELAGANIFTAAADRVGAPPSPVHRRGPRGGRHRGRAAPVAAPAVPVLQPDPGRSARTVQPGLCRAAARRGRRPERRLSLGGAGPAVHRADRGLRRRRGPGQPAATPARERRWPGCCSTPGPTRTTARRSTTGCSRRPMSTCELLFELRARPGGRRAVASPAGRRRSSRRSRCWPTS